MSNKYRKKPVVIEAIQFTGTEDNLEKLKDFINRSMIITSDFFSDNYIDRIKIKALDGDVTATIGDYIIEGVDGEHYPCKSDVFEKTYEKVE